MIAIFLRPLSVAALLLSTALGLGLPAAHGDESTKAPPASASVAVKDTTSHPETPAERVERLKKRSEDDQKSVEYEAKQHASSADAREKAIDEFLTLVEKNPKDFELRFKLANAYHEMGYLHSALTHYNLAIDIDSTQSKALVNRGALLRELGRLDEATESFRLAIASNPKDALAQVNLGDMLLTQKKYMEAVDSYRSAIAIDPASPNAYYSLAIAFAESGMYRDAARSWRKSAELSSAKGTPLDQSNAERALENAKLMDEIVADAATELEARKVKQQELGASGGGEGEKVKDSEKAKDTKDKASGGKNSKKAPKGKAPQGGVSGQGAGGSD